MTTKRILEIVQARELWRDDPYRLAVLVAQEQREDHAALAESLDAQPVADAIRSEA